MASMVIVDETEIGFDAEYTAEEVVGTVPSVV
jgi:hypothetical protein